MATEMDLSLALEPMPGKVVIGEDQDEMKINGLWLIRQRDGVMGTVKAVFQSFVRPETDEMVDPHLQVGDRVIFGPNAGMQITISGQKFRILKESEVLVRVHEKIEQPSVSVE